MTLSLKYDINRVSNYDVNNNTECQALSYHGNENDLLLSLPLTKFRAYENYGNEFRFCGNELLFYGNEMPFNGNEFL